LERLLGLLLGGLQTGLQTDVIAGDPHAAAAAAGRRLDEHGEADRVRQPQRLAVVGDESLTAGYDGYAILLRQLAGLVLVAQQAHRLLGRTDELDLARAAHLGEVRVLREEAVAGMDRLHIAALGRRDEARDVQIALGRQRRADADRLIGEV